MPTPRRTTNARKPAARKPAARKPAARKPTARKAPVVPHLTVAERRAKGKAARAEVPRGGHGEWTAPGDRTDPIALLEQQAATRVPELVPLRYGRMLASPFTFYRGAAYLMAADLARTPTTALHTQLCGDAHLSNFGVYAAPDRQLVFDLNDFDETLPGPFEWDVKRLVTSFEVAARDRGFGPGERKRITQATARSYREAIREFSTMDTLDLWYLRISTQDILERVGPLATDAELKRAEKNLAKARAKTNLRALDKLTERVDGELRIRHDPPKIVPLRELAPAGATAEQISERLHEIVRSYRVTLNDDRRQLLERFRLVDAGRKVVGVGSVGTRAWIALLLGRDDRDPLFLQIKEAEASVLEPFVKKSRFAQHGQRVVEGQRLMQAASDIMLGWLKTTDPEGIPRHYYVRQLWDQKGSALVEVMEPNAMAAYGNLCGWTLARAHARAGDAVAIASYLGGGDTFEKALAKFAAAYADQNERDYAALKDAVDTGRVKAEFETEA